MTAARQRRIFPVAVPGCHGTGALGDLAEPVLRALCCNVAHSTSAMWFDRVASTLHVDTSLRSDAIVTFAVVPNKGSVQSRPSRATRSAASSAELAGRTAVIASQISSRGAFGSRTARLRSAIPWSRSRTALRSSIIPSV